MTNTIESALAALRAAGTAAGLATEEIATEAASYAAGICADDPSSAPAWAAAVGRPESDFERAAIRGRSWRNEPTPLLAHLAERHDAGAVAYARALVDLAAATATIAAPNLERINAAGFAASAQLRAVAPPAHVPNEPISSTPPVAESSPPPTPSPPASPNAPVAESPPTLDELLANLDSLIGLVAVKDEVHHQTELLRVDSLRRSEGLKTPDVSRHLVFSGNPGTGKTTVARLVAGIYRALGILAKGQLVETDRSGLVAGYVGQTALKTAEVVKSAIGGVLFVDEAYALASDDFGGEAINTLVKAMEDHREELVLVVAGYTRRMVEFIVSNPGLESRFRTTIHFADYTDDELVAIFRKLCEDVDFTATEECIGALRAELTRVARDENFGNARYIRNQFEAAVVRQAWRLRDIVTPSIEQLRTLVPEDLAT